MLSVENELKVPMMYWYQNSSTVYIKIEVSGCDDKNIEVKDNKLKLNKLIENIIYKIDLELENSIEDFKINTSKFSVHLELNKKEESWWNKLSNSIEYKRYIKADWDNWMEEDDEEENMMSGMPGMGGMENMMGGMPGMGGMENMMGGMPGMGGMDMEEMMKNMGDMPNMDEMNDDSPEETTDVQESAPEEATLEVQESATEEATDVQESAPEEATLEVSP